MLVVRANQKLLLERPPTSLADYLASSETLKFLSLSEQNEIASKNFRRGNLTGTKIFHLYILRPLLKAI